MTAPTLLFPAGTVPRLLFLGQDAATVQRQLAGEALDQASAGALRDDVSTDEITPVHILSHYDARLGRFVYAGMIDIMRGVSTHVTIGRALKGGKFMDAWFVLCREDR